MLTVCVLIQKSMQQYQKPQDVKAKVMRLATRQEPPNRVRPAKEGRRKGHESIH